MSQRPLFPGTWAGEGICREVDPELFFPSSPNEYTNAKAKAVCAKCPVVAACLEWALDNEHHGVWGGTSPGEREQFRKSPWFASGLREIPTDREADRLASRELDRKIHNLRRGGMTHAEVAVSLGMSHGAVMKRVERAAAAARKRGAA